MRMNLFQRLVLAAVLTGAMVARAAEPANSGEDRLREALRNSLLQLQSAQGELAVVKAAQAADAEEKKNLTAKYETLKKEMLADRAGTDKKVAALTAENADQKAAIAKLTDDLAKARAEGTKSAAEAQVAQAQVTKLTAVNHALERRAADREAKNLALFTIGNEILSRYEEFSLGNAIRAKEPFVGLTRTKLENLVQDYQDRLLDQRIRP